MNGQCNCLCNLFWRAVEEDAKPSKAGNAPEIDVGNLANRLDIQSKVKFQSGVIAPKRYHLNVERVV